MIIRIIYNSFYFVLFFSNKCPRRPRKYNTVRRVVQYYNIYVFYETQ